MHFEPLNAHGDDLNDRDESSVLRKRKSLRRKTHIRKNDERESDSSSDSEVKVKRRLPSRAAKQNQNLNENKLINLAITSPPILTRKSTKPSIPVSGGARKRAVSSRDIKKVYKERSSDDENSDARSSQGDASDSSSGKLVRHKKRSSPTRHVPKRKTTTAAMSYREDACEDSESGSEIMYLRNTNESSKTSSSPFSEVASGNDADIKENDDSRDMDGDESDCGTQNSYSTNSDASNVHYHIQLILGSQTLTQREWRKITDNMHTQEVMRGSVWKATDKEYFDDSDRLVEKFLIKWSHCSYLHVSWEVESDLVELVGPHAKRHIERYRQRIEENNILFEDLGLHEYFPKSFVTIERVLDVADDGVVLNKIDPEVSLHPNYSRGEDGSTSMVTEVSSSDNVQSRKNEYLHTQECYLTVKWEGLPYVDVSFENINDLYHARVQYVPQLRSFYALQQSKPCKRVRRQHVNLDEIETPNGQLRDYQETGIRWLYFNWLQKRNSILADEMGLGKTIQCAVFLEMLHQKQKLGGPFLIIVPLSTLIHWRRELQNWTTMDVVVYYGSHVDRSLIYDFEFNFMMRPTECKLQIVLTTYESIILADSKGRKPLSKIDWFVTIIDEAHRLKNYQSKLYATLVNQFRFQSSVLLTGTPLQNNTEELWTLLHFLNPVEFPYLNVFVEEYGALTDSAQLSSLHSKLQPYILRRLKSVVETTIPIKKEVLIQVELTSYQRRYYKAIFERNRDFLYQNSKSGPQLSNITMELRKCCNHLFLVKNAESEVRKVLPNSLIYSSTKIILLDKLLHKLHSDGHKVLIFSQFKMMLDILEEYLHNSSYSYARIDGDIVGRHRQYVIDKYTSSDTFIMLLSTKAGGVGINLTAADTVIIYDNSFNPQDDIQAMARVHRIGQVKPVTVYRFLTKNTYEMFMFDIASKKLGLNYAIMNDIEISASSGKSTALTKKEIENLLRFGAYDVFNNAEANDSITNESIDHILEHCSTVVETNGKAEKNSFSKAVFVTDNDQKININDPSFWEKMLPVIEKPDEPKSRRRAACNYKEKSIYVDSSSYEEDSDRNENSTSGTSLSGASAKSYKSSKSSRKKSKFAGASFIWTSRKLFNLFTILAHWGYPNFSNISRYSGLSQSSYDIALGSRQALLGALRYIVSRSDGLCHQLVDGQIKEVAVTEKNSRFEDILKLRKFYTNSKLCRLLVSALCAPSVSNSDDFVEDILLREAIMAMKSYDASILQTQEMPDAAVEQMWIAFGMCSFDYDYKKVHRMQATYKTKWMLMEQHLDVYILMLMLTMNIEPNQIPETAGTYQETHLLQRRAFNPYVTDIFAHLKSMIPDEEAPTKWWQNIHDVLLLLCSLKHGFLHIGKQAMIAANIAKYRDSIKTIKDVREFYQSFVLDTCLSSDIDTTRRIAQVVGALRGQVCTDLTHSSRAIVNALLLYGRPYDIYTARKTQQGSSNESATTVSSVITGEYAPSACFITWEKILSLIPVRMSIEMLKRRITILSSDILVEYDREEQLSVTQCISKKLLVDIAQRVGLLHRLRLMLLAPAEKLHQAILLACYRDGTTLANMSLPPSWTACHDQNLMRLTCAFGMGVCRVGVAIDGSIEFGEPNSSLGDCTTELDGETLRKRLTHIVASISITAPGQQQPSMKAEAPPMLPKPPSIKTHDSFSGSDTNFNVDRGIQSHHPIQSLLRGLDPRRLEQERQKQLANNALSMLYSREYGAPLITTPRNYYPNPTFGMYPMPMPPQYVEPSRNQLNSAINSTGDDDEEEIIDLTEES